MLSPIVFLSSLFFLFGGKASNESCSMLQDCELSSSYYFEDSTSINGSIVLSPSTAALPFINTTDISLDIETTPASIFTSDQTGPAFTSDMILNQTTITLLDATESLFSYPTVTSVNNSIDQPITSTDHFESVLTFLTSSFDLTSSASTEILNSTVQFDELTLSSTVDVSSSEIEYSLTSTYASFNETASTDILLPTEVSSLSSTTPIISSFTDTIDPSTVSAGIISFPPVSTEDISSSNDLMTDLLLPYSTSEELSLPTIELMTIASIQPSSMSSSVSQSKIELVTSDIITEVLFSTDDILQVTASSDVIEEPTLDNLLSSSMAMTIQPSLSSLFMTEQINPSTLSYLFSSGKETVQTKDSFIPVPSLSEESTSFVVTNTPVPSSDEIMEGITSFIAETPSFLLSSSHIGFSLNSDNITGTLPSSTEPPLIFSSSSMGSSLSSSSDIVVSTGDTSFISTSNIIVQTEVSSSIMNSSTISLSKLPSSTVIPTSSFASISSIIGITSISTSTSTSIVMEISSMLSPSGSSTLITSLTSSSPAPVSSLLSSSQGSLSSLGSYSSPAPSSSLSSSISSLASYSSSPAPSSSLASDGSSISSLASYSSSPAPSSSLASDSSSISSSALYSSSPTPSSILASDSSSASLVSYSSSALLSSFVPYSSLTSLTLLYSSPTSLSSLAAYSSSALPSISLSPSVSINYSFTAQATTVTSVSSFTLSEAVTLSPSTATIISTIIPSPTVLLQNIARIVFRLAASELGLIATVGSNERAQLEDSIVAVYRQGLSTLGGRRKRQLSSSPRAYITDVGSLSNDGTAPVDFYISVDGQPVLASTVVGILTRVNPQNISNYDVVTITVPETGTVTSSPTTTPLVIIVGISMGGVLLALVLCLIFMMCIILLTRNRKKKSDVSHIELQAFATGEEVLPERLQPAESIAIQHGTPAIDKLTRRAKLRKSNPLPTTSSTMALLASSSDAHLDAWQREQLMAPQPMDEPPAALFEHVTHYSDLSSATPTIPTLMRFHTAIGPSPSTTTSSGNLVKPVLVTEMMERKQSRRSNRERMKLQSQQRRIGSRQRAKTAQSTAAEIPQKSEGEEGLGDVEASSHSDGKALSPQPTASRPSTRKKRRKLLSSRGIPIAPTTDGYDTTVDQMRPVPASRQSRKYRSGRSMRARPLTQSGRSSVKPHYRSNTGPATATGYDSRTELAWMSTSDGVQLVSIQPLQSSQPPQRPTWQHLPHLVPPVQQKSTNQTYTQQQIKELLQLHKELERVEQGLGTVHTGASLTPDSTADTTHVHHPLPHHPSDISYSAEELALQAFGLPTNGVQQHSFSMQNPPPQQMVWSPHRGGAPIRSQPLAPVHLSQLRRHNPNLGVLYPSHPPHQPHQPWGYQ